MSFVQVTDVQVLDNPAPFLNPFCFEISFEVSRPLQEDLLWKVTYVGSADSEEYDQVLEEVLVGPVSVGENKFVLQTSAPDPARVPKGDLVGVTVVLLTCSYRGDEFIRIGYYVNNEIHPDRVAHYESAFNAHEAAASGGAAQAGTPAQAAAPSPAAAAPAGGDEDEDSDENMSGDDVEVDDTAGEEEARLRRFLAGNIDPKDVVRSVFADKPRVTRIHITWDDAAAAAEGGKQAQAAVGEAEQQGNMSVA